MPPEWELNGRGYAGRVSVESSFLTPKTIGTELT